MKRALLLATLWACGESVAPAPAPARPPAPRYDARELAELADGLLDVFDAMAAVVEAHPDDCSGMGRELSQLLDKAAPITARIKVVAADKDGAAALAAQLRRHDVAARALNERISVGLRACANDADVRAAVDKMPMF